MIIRLTPKRATFSSTHSLTCFGPDHKCANTHGHTWWVQATFEGRRDGDGVLIDYAIVPQVVKQFDHVDLDKTMAVPATGENILAELVALFSAAAAERPDCRVVRVELVEDPIPGDAHTLIWSAVAVAGIDAATRFVSA